MLDHQCNTEIGKQIKGFVPEQKSTPLQK